MKNKLPIVILFSLICAAALAKDKDADSKDKETTAKDRAAVSKELASRTGHELKLSSEKTPSFPPGVAFSGSVTEGDAVAIALWNNSALEAAASSLGLARADLVDAGVIRNLSVQALLPVGSRPFEFALQAPIEVLWQRPRRVAAAQLDLEKVSKTLVQSGLDLVRDTRLAHADLDMAQTKVRIAREFADLRAHIAELTDLRLKAGDISEMDALSAHNEVRISEEQAQRLTRDIETAGERLRTLMGLRGDKTAIRALPGDDSEMPVPEWDVLLEISMFERPDLRAAELSIEAATKKARWERSRVLTLIAPILSIKETGAGLRPSPGLAFDAPVFNRNKGGISRADAEVSKAAMGYLALRDRIELEVREARLQLHQARESLRRIRTDILPGIAESIRFAEKAHASGDASYLSVLETTSKAYDARFREAEAIAAVRRARAQVEHSIGRKL